MDKRVQFDFEIDFTNGGGLQGQDFRLDINGDDISDEKLAKYRRRYEVANGWESQNTQQKNN